MINTITDYNVVYANTIEIIHLNVSDFIKSGWQPFGNMVFNPNNSCYYQPMVKYK